MGNNCGYVPDITLMSFILFFGTYTCSMALKKFKTSRYFPTTVSVSFHPSGLVFLLFRSAKISLPFGITVARRGRNALQGSQVDLVEVKTWLTKACPGLLRCHSLDVSGGHE